MTGFADLGLLGYEGMGQELTSYVIDPSQPQPPGRIDLTAPVAQAALTQPSAAIMTPAAGWTPPAAGGGMMASLNRYLPYLMLGAAAIFLLPRLMKKKNPCRVSRRRRRRTH